jgi:hypothetical protein
MNIINKHPLTDTGYHFIEKKYLPKGKDEYHLRNLQNRSVRKHLPLTKDQISILEKNHNSSDNWNKILVSNNFNPKLVKNCKFFGLIRIGQLKEQYHEFHNFKMPVGIYNSTIISCDLGDNVCIDNVNYLSHYIIEDDVMLANINELATTDKACFGNGILKEGDTDEKKRMVIEVCNENGGRSIIPFNGMLAGDAYMWSKFRDDDALLNKFKEFTEKKFDRQRGYYGKICARTVIKNTGIIKDVWIGSDAYIKGANKLKNLTINSDAERKSQIGEGCELVNGIVGFGCRIFYGVKAVRFITAAHSQLKYGARLINSYLGNNSTISCCEVLNSMIFPAHEQHHNNSFLCASLIMGQSNIAAGATIGSNHNSRSADGEIIAGRGFWPGLCVSLKHNSKFASFSIIAKGDYSNELNIPTPFSLIINDYSKDRLVVMPAYWFMYNMYALARNAKKYEDRDKRTYKFQQIEFDFLAPDTINEMFNALQLFEKIKVNAIGEAEVSGWENSKRKTIITKVPQAKDIYTQMIQLYAANALISFCQSNDIKSFEQLKSSVKIPKKRSSFHNVGGQLIRHEDLEKLKADIKKNKLKYWEDIHQFYFKQGANYSQTKLQHALTSLLELWKIPASKFDAAAFKTLIKKAIETKEWMTTGVYESRAKDYTNPFRKMVYDNLEEMNNVIGKLEDNSFIKEQQAELQSLKKSVNAVIRKLKL